MFQLSGPTAFLTASQSLSPPKMGVFDGVYKLDMTQADPNWAALHKEMGKKGANAVGARIEKKPPRYP